MPLSRYRDSGLASNMTTREVYEAMGWTDLFERLRRATGLTSSQVAAIEKRRAFRVRRRMSLSGTRKDGQSIALVAVNFGPRGLRVETSVRLKRDEALHLQRVLQPEEREVGSLPPSFLTRVIWVRPQPRSLGYEVGLVFVTSTESQARAAATFLVDGHVGYRDPRENRRAPRYAGDVRGSLMTPDCHTYEVAVRDISVGGALVLMARPVERNTEVALKFTLPHTSSPITCQGTVVRCTRVRGGAHELGIAFTGQNTEHRGALVDRLSLLLQSK